MEDGIKMDYIEPFYSESLISKIRFELFQVEILMKLPMWLTIYLPFHSIQNKHTTLRRL